MIVYRNQTSISGTYIYSKKILIIYGSWFLKFLTDLTKLKWLSRIKCETWILPYYIVHILYSKLYSDIHCSPTTVVDYINCDNGFVLELEYYVYSGKTW